MSVLFYGVILFMLALLIHITIWKIRLPVHQKSILLLLFGTILTVSIVILVTKAKSINLFGISVPNTLYEYMQLFILFSSLSLAYMVTYSALEADSPSLVIVMVIAKSKENGLGEKILGTKINDEILLTPRLKDLVSERLAYVKDGVYRLTPKGIMCAHLFFLYRRLINRPNKGG